MYNEAFRFEDGIMNVNVTGQFPNELLRTRRNVFQPLADACATHQCKKALVDARDLQIEMGTLELLKAGKDVAAMLLKGICVAFLAREDMLDPFFETVVVNRGGLVGVFTEMDAAQEWLEQRYR